MPRVARIVIPDVPHHVTQRGNNREEVFFSGDDRRAYLDVLREQSEKFALDILGYCLMTNHVHLIAVPRRPDSLAKAVGRADWLYTREVNRRLARSGHLWQNRFYSCALGEKHAAAAMRYVEENPVRAGIKRLPWTYEWSSARAHVTGKDETGLLDLEGWLRDWPPGAWRRMLRERLERETADALRTFTARGRPWGTGAFVAQMEKLLGRTLHARPLGRPVGWRKGK